MADHKGIAYAYKLALQAYFDTNDASSSISEWAQWQLPLATDQKQVVEDRMEQLQNVLKFDPTSDTTLSQQDFKEKGVTDPWVLSLLSPDNNTHVSNVSDVHGLYSSVAGIVTSNGNAADQTFSQNSQSAMGASTQSTSALTSLGGMLQGFVQAMNAAVTKI